jgi:nitrite reductase/ring-hydroxylating ferredoxin subunit
MSDPTREPGEPTGEWNSVAATGECPPGKRIERIAGGRAVAIFNVEGTFYAIDSVCAHQGGPLSEGTLDGCEVACPWHSLRFNVTTGESNLGGAVRQEVFRVRVQAGSIQLFLPAS